MSIGSTDSDRSKPFSDVNQSSYAGLIVSFQKDTQESSEQSFFTSLGHELTWTEEKHKQSNGSHPESDLPRCFGEKPLYKIPKLLRTQFTLIFCSRAGERVG